MLLIDLWFPEALGSAVILAALAIWGLKNEVKARMRFIRVGERVLCVLVAELATLAVILLLASSGCASHSAAIYSPSGNFAARVENAGGAIGGSTAVELFWAHGFMRKIIYVGSWKSVEPSDVEWAGSSELKIRYSAGSLIDCTSIAQVEVTCSVISPGF
jgi:hypothetical protein